MKCRGNPATITTGTTQTIAFLKLLPLTTPNTEPLKTVKVLAMDVIIIAPTQEATLVIVIIVKMATTSQLLVIAEAKIIMSNFKTNQGPILVACKTPTMVVTAISMIITNGIGDRTAIFPTILAQKRNISHHTFKSNLQSSTCCTCCIEAKYRYKGLQ